MLFEVIIVCFLCAFLNAPWWFYLLSVVITILGRITIRHDEEGHICIGVRI